MSSASKANSTPVVGGKSSWAISTSNLKGSLSLSSDSLVATIRTEPKPTATQMLKAKVTNAKKLRFSSSRSRIIFIFFWTADELFLIERYATAVGRYLHMVKK